MTGYGVGTLASYVWDGIGDLTAINRGNGADTTYAYDSNDDSNAEYIDMIPIPLISVR